MSLTFGLLAQGIQRVGNCTKYPCSITFDSSYADDGETVGGLQSNGTALFTPARVFGVEIFGRNAAAMNYDWAYNYSTNKLQAFKPAPGLIVEEVLAVSSNAATLQRVPAYILGIEVTAGSVTGAFRSIPTGETPVTKQVAVTLTTGAMAFLSSDAVTAARVTYIPLGVGPFIEANRVVDEAVTFGSGTGDTFDLANRAALIQYVWNDTASGASRLPAIQPVGEAPGANQIAIDINNSGATTITHHSGQDTNAGKVTYWKYSALSKFGWTDQADITVTSDAVLFSEVLDLGGIFIPAFGEVIVGETGASANKQAVMIGPSGSAAADVAVFNPSKNSLTLANADGYGTIEMPYIVLDANTLGNVRAEVPASEDLSGCVLRAWVNTYPSLT